VFKLVTLEDAIRIPPERFGEEIDNVGYEQLKMKYDGMVDEELGYVIAVTHIRKIQEVIEGEVVEIAEFGAFIRIGPVDALLHVSQLMDDYISYDERQGVLMGKETKRKLKTGDRVRVRITAVSLGRSGGSGKIGVTARQPFLGKIEWIRKEVEKIEEPDIEVSEDAKTAGESEK
jgi:DNA-directed RNA polymerase subunit E'